MQPEASTDSAAQRQHPGQRAPRPTHTSTRGDLCLRKFASEFLRAIQQDPQEHRHSSLFDAAQTFASLVSEQHVGSASDGSDCIAGMFYLLPANALFATPSSPPHQSLPTNPLSPRDSPAPSGLYVWGGSDSLSLHIMCVCTKVT